MKKQSAGILLYRSVYNVLQVLLVHPGGPLWTKKNVGAWSVPKGEFENDEDPLTAANREFFEETGSKISGKFIPLSPVKQKSGKMVHVFAVEGDLNAAEIKSNIFMMEWPPKSGKRHEFPEVDKAEWFDIETAKRMINEAQAKAIDELIEYLK